jgi:hypothetical protein
VLKEVGCVLERWTRFLYRENLIPHNIIVSRSSSSLQCRVSLKVEIPISRFSDSTVNHRAVLGIGGPIRPIFVSWVETSVVTFPNDYDRKAWEAILIHWLTRGFQKWDFLLHHKIVLTLRNSVTVHNYVLGKLPVHSNPML